MQVDILYKQLLDSRGQRLLAGGVETYLLNLGRLCSEVGFETTVYQVANQDFEVHIDSIRIVGVPLTSLNPTRQALELMRVASRGLKDDAARILIFGADHFSFRTRDPRSILIQHGIFWDLPITSCARGVIRNSLVVALLRQARVFWLAKQAFDNTTNRVCVDYNFLNWYRTVSICRLKGKIWVIPNFSHSLDWATLCRNKPADGTVCVLFARRFQDYRGTRILAEAVKDVLSRVETARFTFAGEGPEEEWLRNEFREEARVRFSRYDPDEAVDVHSRHHVAVVPSLGSEGTSFAVAEAMGAGCVVIATNVGGITNMILDGYNGLLIMPTTESLYDALMKVVSDEALRRRLSLRAWETAQTTFSLERWKKQWTDVLEEIATVP